MDVMRISDANVNEEAYGNALRILETGASEVLGALYVATADLAPFRESRKDEWRRIPPAMSYAVCVRDASGKRGGSLRCGALSALARDMATDAARHPVASSCASGRDDVCDIVEYAAHEGGYAFAVVDKTDPVDLASTATMLALAIDEAAPSDAAAPIGKIVFLKSSQRLKQILLRTEAKRMPAPILFCCDDCYRYGNAVDGCDALSARFLLWSSFPRLSCGADEGDGGGLPLVLRCECRNSGTGSEPSAFAQRAMHLSSFLADGSCDGRIECDIDDAVEHVLYGDDEDADARTGADNCGVWVDSGAPRLLKRLYISSAASLAKAGYAPPSFFSDAYAVATIDVRKERASLAEALLASGDAPVRRQEEGIAEASRLDGVWRRRRGIGADAAERLGFAVRNADAEPDFVDVCIVDGVNMRWRSDKRTLAARYTDRLGKALPLVQSALASRRDGVHAVDALCVSDFGWRDYDEENASECTPFTRNESRCEDVLWLLFAALLADLAEDRWDETERKIESALEGLDAEAASEALRSVLHGGRFDACVSAIEAGVAADDVFPEMGAM